MTTFARIKHVAESNNCPVSTSIDDATPAGHFCATTKIHGDVVTYLLEGEKDNLNAALKGHVLIIDKEEKSVVLGYRGRGVASGEYLGRVESYKAAFAKMV